MPTTESATYFPPGTLIGVDRDGTHVHVGDVVEWPEEDRRKFHRSVVTYRGKAACFVVTLAMRFPPGIRTAFEPGRVRVIRRWDDPRGAVQEGDPILAPSSEPWDRTVRIVSARVKRVLARRGERNVVELHASEGGRPWTLLVGTAPLTPGTLDTVTGVFTPDP